MPAWTPTQLSNTEMWIDTSILTTSGGATSGALTSFTDKTGNITFSQSNASQKPTIGGSQNGLRYLDFAKGEVSNSTEDNLSGTLASLASLGTGDHWIICLASHSGTYDDGNYGALMTMGRGGASQGMLVRRFDSTAYGGSTENISFLGYDPGTLVTNVSGSDPGDNNIFMFYTERVSQAQSVYSNGASSATGTDSSATHNIGNSTVTFGSEVSVFGSWDGNVYEFLYGTGTLTSSERDQLEGYIAHRWGVQSLLPSGHTYKSAAPTIPGGLGAGFSDGALNNVLSFDLSSDLSFGLDTINTSKRPRK